MRIEPIKKNDLKKHGVMIPPSKNIPQMIAFIFIFISVFFFFFKLLFF